MTFWVKDGAILNYPLNLGEMELKEHDFIRDRRQKLGWPKRRQSGNPTALCLSGGGVRSASYCLGVLQALAKGHILKNFDYLSTVSGGGYAGAFLSRWAYEDGFAEVEKELASDFGFGKVGSPLYHLRQYISYLAPSLGILNLDSLAGAGLYVRNLLVNWFIIIPFLLALTILPQFANHAVKTFSTVWAFLFAATFALMALAEAARRRPSFAELSKTSSDPPFASLFVIYSLPLFLASLFAAVSMANPTDLLPALESVTVPSCTENARFICVPWIRILLVCLLVVILVVVWPVMLAQRQADSSGTWNLGEFCKRYARNLFSLAVQFTVFLGLISAGIWFLINASDTYSLKFPDLLITFFPLLFTAAFFSSEAIYHAIQGNPKWGDQEREWTARSTGSLVALPLFWSLLSFCSISGYAALSGLIGSGGLQSTATGTMTGVAGLFSLALARSGKIYGLAKKGFESWKELGARWSLNVLLAAFVFLLLSILGKLDQFFTYLFRANAGGDDLFAAFFVFVVAIFIGMGIDSLTLLNKFTLHSIYRNRIVRSFVGASSLERRANATHRKPRGFTDFLATDNLELSELRKCRKAGGVPPSLHLVNMALNIPGSSELALQERKALPFCASAFAIGSRVLTYEKGGIREDGCFRDAKDYASKGEHSISLGTVAAISGAAADPSMGTHTIPALRFLFTFFNVRLGMWLGNPGNEGRDTFKDDGPKLMLLPLVQEFAGLANEKREYIHLSDGGHFDNLGLYEVLARRCSFVVVVDAGCDPEFAFEDLGRVQRIAQIDLNAEIEFDPRELKKFKLGKASFAIGSIAYRNAEGTVVASGTIAYIKPSIGDTAQPQISSYHSENPSFPHDSTANQWFTESQFMAYERLGNADGALLVEALKKCNVPAIKGWFT